MSEVPKGYDGCGCNIRGIISIMIEEQREHSYASFGDTYIKYRKVVSEWMLDVCEYFSLHATTTHAAVAYLDRLQPNEKFNRQQWQMLAICCILISAKYNECEEHVPDLATLEEITQQSISNETVLNYELWALKRMAWKLNARTPMAFLSSYIVAGVTFESDKCDLFCTPGEMQYSVSKDINSLANLCLLDTRFKQFQASEIACAIIFSVRKSLNVQPLWPSELVELLATEDPLSNTCAVSEIIHLIDEVKQCKPKEIETVFNTPSSPTPKSPTNSFDHLGSPVPSSYEKNAPPVTPESNNENESKFAFSRTSPLSVAEVEEPNENRCS